MRILRQRTPKIRINLGIYINKSGFSSHNYIHTFNAKLQESEHIIKWLLYPDALGRTKPSRPIAPY